MTFVKPFRNVSAGGFSEVVADNKFKFYIKIVCRKHEVGYGDLSILGQRIKKFRGSSRFFQCDFKCFSAFGSKEYVILTHPHAYAGR